MSKERKKYGVFAENLRTLMKRWDISNRKMADLISLNPSNVDTLRRSVTQPSVPVILRLEELTGVESKLLYHSNLEFNDFPVQPILHGETKVEDPRNSYLTSSPLADLPMADFIKHVESLTSDLLQLREEFQQYKEKHA